MFSIKAKFKKSPQLFYAMSIAATWAGVGSLMMGIEMMQKYGIIPFLLWALGNTLACILFGVIAPKMPKLRKVFHCKTMKLIVGLMCPFQVWISMNGIQDAFAGTPLNGIGKWLAYSIAVFFILLLVRYGMIRNVLTDHCGWIAVYAIGLALTVASMIYSHGNMQPISLGRNAVSIGIEKCILLLPGAFLYPYFFEIIDYNNQNADGTKKINVCRTFALGGFLFGAYLLFTFLLAWTKFSPALNIIKAFLIVLIASSSLSSFLYSVYISFGRKLGLVVNVAAVAAWQLVIPLGVMGVWTLMSRFRLAIVAAAFIIAIVLHFTSEHSLRKEVM